MNNLRAGITGRGNLGRQHADHPPAGKVGPCELNAVCSSLPQKPKGCRGKRPARFNDSELFFRSGDMDAVVIAAPRAALMRIFTVAITDSEPTPAPAAAGFHSVEPANAMVYSPLPGETGDLPLDGAAWERKLNELIAGLKIEKKAAATGADDFAVSVRKHGGRRNHF